MKKLKIVFIVLSVAILSNVKVENSKITTEKAYARDGTCCNEEASVCIVNNIVVEDRYYKSEGRCNEVGESD